MRIQQDPAFTFFQRIGPSGTKLIYSEWDGSNIVSKFTCTSWNHKSLFFLNISVVYIQRFPFSKNNSWEDEQCNAAEFPWETCMKKGLDVTVKLCFKHKASQGNAQKEHISVHGPFPLPHPASPYLFTEGQTDWLRLLCFPVYVKCTKNNFTQIHGLILSVFAPSLHAYLVAKLLCGVGLGSHVHQHLQSFVICCLALHWITALVRVFPNGAIPPPYPPNQSTSLGRARWRHAVIIVPLTYFSSQQCGFAQTCLNTKFLEKTHWNSRREERWAFSWYSQGQHHLVSSKTSASHTSKVTSCHIFLFFYEMFSI